MNLLDVANENAGPFFSTLEGADAPIVPIEQERVSVPRSHRIFRYKPTQYEQVFDAAAAAFELSPDLLRAVAFHESQGDQSKVSPKGAIGVMQLMPGTAKDEGVDPNNPEENIFGGASYLRKVLDRFGGDIPKALAAYNHGPNRSKYSRDDWDKHLPPETIKYVGEVLEFAANLEDEKRGVKGNLPDGVKPSQVEGGRGVVHPPPALPFKASPEQLAAAGEHLATGAVVDPQAGGGDPQFGGSVSAGGRDDANLGGEIVKGLKRGWTGLKSVLPATTVGAVASPARASSRAIEAFDEVDSKGLSSDDIRRQVRPGKLPSFAQEQAILYANADEPTKLKLRGQQLASLFEDKEIIVKALAALDAYNAEAAKSKASVSKASEINSFPAAVEWLAGAVPEGAVSTIPVLVAALAPVVGGAVLTAATSYGMAYSEVTRDRVEYVNKKLQDRFKNPDRQAELTPEQKAEFVREYVADTGFATAAAAVPFAAMDTTLGMAPRLLGKRGAMPLPAGATRADRMGAAVRDAPSVVGEEFGTGTAQEAIKILAKQQLGEQPGPFFTEENITGLFDAGMAEAAGTVPFAAARVGLAALPPKVEEMPTTPQAPTTTPPPSDEKKGSEDAKAGGATTPSPPSGTPPGEAPGPAGAPPTGAGPATPEGAKVAAELAQLLKPGTGGTIAVDGTPAEPTTPPVQPAVDGSTPTGGVAGSGGGVAAVSAEGQGPGGAVVPAVQAAGQPTPAVATVPGAAAIAATDGAGPAGGAQPVVEPATGSGVVAGDKGDAGAGAGTGDADLVPFEGKLAPQSPTAVGMLNVSLEKTGSPVRLKVSTKPLTAAHKLASMFARALGKTLTVVEFESSDPKSPPPEGMARLSGKHIFLSSDSDDGPLFIGVHEALHTLPKPLRAKLEKTLFEMLQPKHGQDTRLAEFLNDYNYQSGAAEFEWAGMLSQALSKQGDFWTQLRDKLGDHDFAQVAALVLRKLNQMLRGVKESVRADAFLQKYLPELQDVERARDLITTAYAEAMRAQNQKPDPAVVGGPPNAGGVGAPGTTPEGHAAESRKATNGQQNRTAAGPEQDAAVGEDSREGADGTGAEHPSYGVARGGATTVIGYHYSKDERTSLTSGFYGTGLQGAERSRLAGYENSDIRPRVYFYADSGNGVQPESGVGGVPHAVELRNIYDATVDPLGIVRGAQGDEQTRANGFERAVMRAGFDGYVVTFGPQRVVALLGAQHTSVPVVMSAPRGRTGYVPRTTSPIRDSGVARRRVTMAGARRVDTGKLEQAGGWMVSTNIYAPRDRVEDVDAVLASQGVEDGDTGWIAASNPAAESTREGAVQDPGGVRGGPRVLAKSDRPYSRAGRKGTTLEGLPSPVDVNGRDIEFFGFKPAQDAAKDYMQKQGRPYIPPTKYVKVDKERAAKVADAFDKAQHDPSNPEVRRAYRAMIDETAAQYQAAVDAGLKVEFIAGDDPYFGNPRNVIFDVVENNHMWVFSTRDGFGTSDFDPVDNPLLEETEFEISGQKALANDLFRVVHDYFGHIKEGVGFRADGEENAWRAHSAMYSPTARRAMTSETRGQNSWLNFGPHGDKNRTAKVEDTMFADQKIVLLPDWVVYEGANDVGGDVTIEVPVEGGRTARLTMNAADALQVLDSREDALQMLKECLG